MIRAFTLLELLVVITIIVVLLALLTPALDKAINESMYVVDGAQMRSVANGVTLYATANKRMYPYRVGVAFGTEPKQISNNNYDDRVRFHSYFPMQAFNDPFLPIEVDWDIFYDGNETHPNAPTYTIYASYPLLFGVRYQDANAGRGMIRLGDRLVYDEQVVEVLLADKDSVWDAIGWGSHEPTSGPYVPERGNSIDHPNGWTLDRWTYGDIATRGLLDNQAAFTDVSVTRYKELVVRDERLAQLPVFTNGQVYGTRDTYVPISRK